MTRIKEFISDWLMVLTAPLVFITSGTVILICLALEFIYDLVHGYKRSGKIKIIPVKQLTGGKDCPLVMKKSDIREEER